MNDKIKEYQWNDIIDKINSLNGYLKIWQKGEGKPFELNDLINEVDEWTEKAKKANIKLATAWNSPDEKPERIKDGNNIYSDTLALWLINDKKASGYYDGVLNQYWVYEIGVWLRPNKINGWQYLPEIK